MHCLADGAPSRGLAGRGGIDGVFPCVSFRGGRGGREAQRGQGSPPGFALASAPSHDLDADPTGRRRPRFSPTVLGFPPEGLERMHFDSWVVVGGGIGGLGCRRTARPGQWADVVVVEAGIRWEEPSGRGGDEGGFLTGGGPNTLRRHDGERGMRPTSIEGLVEEMVFPGSTARKRYVVFRGSGPVALPSSPGILSPPSFAAGESSGSWWALPEGRPDPTEIFDFRVLPPGPRAGAPAALTPFVSGSMPGTHARHGPAHSHESGLGGAGGGEWSSARSREEAPGSRNGPAGEDPHLLPHRGPAGAI